MRGRQRWRKPTRGEAKYKRRRQRASVRILGPGIPRLALEA